MSDAAEISANIAAVGDWRADALVHLRQLILDAAPNIVEEIKWRKPSNPDGVPAYSHHGLIGTLEHYKDKVKFTFAKGGQLDDPLGVFTGGFGGARRVVDVFEGDSIHEDGFRGLIQAAARLNEAK